MNKKCLRCGIGWQQRVKNPVMCPRCKSPYWDRPRKRVIDTTIEGRIEACVEKLTEEK